MSKRNEVVFPYRSQPVVLARILQITRVYGRVRRTGGTVVPTAAILRLWGKVRRTW